MRPAAIVTVNGQVMAAPFHSRLESIECVDQEGVRSDTCRMVLNDGPEAGFLAIPERGASITVAVGNIAPVLIGAYTLDEVTVQCLPYKMTLSGKAADVREEMKESKARHWDEKTLKDIVSEIAGEHGLSASFAGAVAEHTYEWLGQIDESDLHLLERLARRHNALFAVKNGKLIFAERGAGQTPGGQSLSSFSVTPANIVQGTCRVTFADRAKYKDVVAYYQDRDKVVRKEIRVKADPQGSASYTIGEPLASEGEAEKAADSKAKDLQRAVDRLNVTVLGDPSVSAGMPVTLSGVRPGVDGKQWIAKTVRHRFSKSQFVTSIEAQIKA